MVVTFSFCDGSLGGILNLLIGCRWATVSDDTNGRFLGRKTVFAYTVFKLLAFVSNEEIVGGFVRTKKLLGLYMSKPYSNFKYILLTKINKSFPKQIYIYI